MNANYRLFDYQSPENASSKDGLFLERLDTFMEKCLGDIRAFAERELQPYDETRRCIAQWHAKYLFQPTTVPPSSSSFTPVNSPDRPERVRTVLCEASRILESLSEASGVQSFLLAIDPYDATDGGFLGGSALGREFWRGLRSGGDSGAKSFRTHCATQLQKQGVAGNTTPSHSAERQTSTAPPPLKPQAGPAKSLKNDLYEAVRNALRSVSGIRNAEMKWTNPERLDAFGVRLIGWPDGVPAQNPSTLKSGQNRLLLDAIECGTMRFERLAHYGQVDDQTDGSRIEGEDGGEEVGNDTNDDFSWAYDADASLSSPPREIRKDAHVSSSSSKVTAGNHTPLSTQSLEAGDHFMRSTSWAPEPSIGDSSYNTDYAWHGTLSQSMDSSVEEGVNASTPERPRKRPRSDDPFPAA